MSDQLDARASVSEAALGGGSTPRGRNRLLCALPPDEWELLRPHLRAEQLEVLCNSLHTVEQRCARWLLTTHDQVGGDELILTHDVLSQMLAVRRAGVAEAAGALQQHGLIRCRRGHIALLDRAGLEAVGCECHAGRPLTLRAAAGDAGAAAGRDLDRVSTR
ncbi:MAG: Crp/Fnr family transcriptional regulator [Gemmatirosa sp.]